MNEYVYPIIIFVFILFFIIVFLWRFVRQEKLIKKLLNQNILETNQDLQSLKDQLNRELYVFHNEISRSLKEDLNLLNVNTSSSLNYVQKSMHEGLNSGFNKTNEAFLEMSKQLVSIDETQKHLSSLSQDIIALQNVLTDKKTRGIYGEVELYSILKTAYGLDTKAYMKQFKLSNNNIADAVVFAPKPLEKIVIDSKFPLENYLRMYDKHLSKAQQQKAEKQFERDITKHINDIASKYIIKGETADMAFMFIPAEAIFSEIYARFDGVVSLSYKQKVFLVSPTTLMAYITAIKAIYLGQQQNEKVDLIQKEFIKLSVEFERFEKRYSDVSNSFKKTYRDLNDVNITASKIINRFKEIEAVDLESNKEYENE